jgi:hypothetical protein
MVSLFIAAQALLPAHAASKRPNPPPSICIGAKCVSTPAPGTQKIKWNPGHYMASNSMLYAGDQLAKISGEMDDLAGWDKIRGYRILVSWGALEPAKGQYDFSLLDAMLQRLKTKYGTPRQLVLVVLPGQFGGHLSGQSGGSIPRYIQQGGEYGPSPNGGSYGWWGGSAGYCAALFRPAVMDRYIELIKALGARYDNDPNFEAIMFQEDSWMIGEWLGAPDFPKDGNSAIPQLQRLLTASTTAFPHTSVVMQNTWAGTIGPTMAFQNWMAQNRIAAGSADVVGQSAFDKYNFSMAWGLQAYAGIPIGNVKYSDMRGMSRSMMDVESAELSGGYFAKYGGPYTPLDIVHALNQTYKSSHAFWNHFFGNEQAWGSSIPTEAKWSNMAATLSANPLTNIDYPANYN